MDAKTAQLLVLAAQALAAGAPILGKYGSRRRADEEAWGAYTQQMAALHRIALGLEAAASTELARGATVN